MIPSSVREMALQRNHDGHVGIIRCQNLALLWLIWLVHIILEPWRAP